MAERSFASHDHSVAGGGGGGHPGQPRSHSCWAGFMKGKARLSIPGSPETLDSYLLICEKKRKTKRDVLVSEINRGAIIINMVIIHGPIGRPSLHTLSLNTLSLVRPDGHWIELLNKQFTADGERT